jgi:uncharacterized membrane protein YedE/YeeE
MTESISTATIVVWGGLALAFVYGFVASRANFCTMGAISDVVNMSHWGRMRMWLLAIAVAIIGASLLQWFGQVDLAKSIYPRPRLAWLSAIVGGLTFGVGMSLAGGCANKNLLRAGGGSLRSLVVLAFLGISAYMTIKGRPGCGESTSIASPRSRGLRNEGTDLPLVARPATSRGAGGRRGDLDGC